jgi:PEP-CTERM motif-containing protein
MRKLVLSLIGASALAIGSAASAVVILPGAPVRPGSDPSTSFITSPLVVTPATTGVITATIGHTGITSGNFMDQFLFSIGMTGTGVIGAGSGSIITSATAFLDTTDLDITSVIFNNGITDFAAHLVLRDENGVQCTTRGDGTCGASEGYALSGVPITGGNLNSLTVTGLSRGAGSYGGNLTFTPSVPEPATWAMMLLGFGAIGWQLRRKRGGGALTQFA